jgi:hypothetical protein
VEALMNGKILNAAVVVLGVWAGVGSAAKETLSASDFEAMDIAARARLVKRYVRLNGQGYWETRDFKYRVQTKTSAEGALQIALLMNDFHATFSKIFGPRFRDPVQSEVYVFPDRAAYEEFLKWKRIDAGFSGGMYVHDLHLLAAYQRKDDILRETLFHEGTHQILDSYTLGRELPVWFGEGIATNFETWDPAESRMENIRANVLKTGRRTPVVQALAEGRGYDIRTLIGFTHSSWLKASDPDLNYAMAWSFVNFLLDRPDPQRILDRLFETLTKGDRAERVLTPEVVKKLDAEWGRDQRTRLTLYDKFIAPAMVAHESGLSGPALDVLAEGIKEFPDLPDARFYRAELRVKEKKFAEAREDLERLEDRQAQFPKADYLLAKACLEMKDYAKAKMYARKGLRKSPRDRSWRELLHQIETAGRQRRSGQ